MKMHPQEKIFLWVSNETAYYLMLKGILPPETSEPENNSNYSMIDAQLTTEIFGVLCPIRSDIALKMAHLPIRVTSKFDSEWVSKFYVSMHSLAPQVDSKQGLKKIKLTGSQVNLENYCLKTLTLQKFMITLESYI